MKTLVVYDSFFGNTEQIARAVGRGLGVPASGVLRPKDAGPEQMAGLELLIVGSPTRGFRPTEAVAKWIGNLPGNSLQNVRVAGFDTRIALEDIKASALRLLVKIGGYAAKHIVSALKKKGGKVIAEPEGFFVADEKGPLKAGETERAAEWAKQLR
ncbi:MAG: flavodoxin [candidate division FCPU426 bacterium]